MNRTLAIVALALSLSFGLTACGDNEAPATASTDQAEAPRSTEDKQELAKQMLRSGSKKMAEQKRFQAEKQRLIDEGKWPKNCFSPTLREPECDRLPELEAQLRKQLASE